MEALLSVLYMVGCLVVLFVVAGTDKSDPYFHIACLMQMEGYTDDEIDREIYLLKRANGDLDDPLA